MPMISVITPAGVLPQVHHAELINRLEDAVRQAERRQSSVSPVSDTVAVVHELPVDPMSLTPVGARMVRVRVTMPPGMLSRGSQRVLLATIAEIIAETGGDPTLRSRTRIILTEAVPGDLSFVGARDFAGSRPSRPLRRL